MTTPAMRCGAASCQRGACRSSTGCLPKSAAGREVDRADRILVRQAKPVGRAASVRNDGLAPEFRKRTERLADARCTAPETCLDGAHVDAVADPQELPRAGQARQSLIHRPPLAEMKQGARADRRSLGQRLGVVHKPFGQTLHGSSFRSGGCQGRMVPSVRCDLAARAEDGWVVVGDRWTGASECARGLAGRILHPALLLVDGIGLLPVSRSGRHPGRNT